MNDKNNSVKKVNYTIEEAERYIEIMIAETIAEFNIECDKIDAEYENENKVHRQTNIAE